MLISGCVIDANHSLPFCFLFSFCLPFFFSFLFFCYFFSLPRQFSLHDFLTNLFFFFLTLLFFFFPFFYFLYNFYASVNFFSLAFSLLFYLPVSFLLWLIFSDPHRPESLSSLLPPHSLSITLFQMKSIYFAIV